MQFGNFQIILLPKINQIRDQISLFIVVVIHMATNKQGQPKQHPWHPNRAYFQLANGIVIDSCFPGGNVAAASIVSISPLTIEIQGNTDINLDSSSKYWLYFRIRGYRRDKPIKFILKNANHLRKYFGQSRYRPYMVYKEQEQQWQSNASPIDLCVLENGHFQGSFNFQSQKYCKNSKNVRSTNEIYTHKQQKILSSTNTNETNKGDCYFAMYYPYSYDDLTAFIQKIKNTSNQKVRNSGNNKSDEVYINDETITYSYERRKVPLITITSHNNIQSFSQRQPGISEEIFPNSKERPFKLKNNPVILLTARVHPSETASSFFIEGIIEFLLGDSKASTILREIFIFQIIPMLNPDGVEHGNFRFDHQLRNLNRYYGQSSIEKTPSIRAAELLIDYYKNRNNQQCQFTQFYEQTYSRLFMFVDVHGHSSALPSFIYGNHSQKIEHLIENKMFCKLLEVNFVQGGFSKIESEFSKKNMTLQEKYDQFSKLCSGRVFAGRSCLPEQSLFHSYTMEVLPYWEEFPRRRNEQKSQKMNAVDYARQLGKHFLISLLDLLDLNPQSKLNEFQIDKIRKNIAKQCYNEQARRQFSFKRNECPFQKIPYCEITKLKQNSSQRDLGYYNEYIERWFNNQIFLKHLLSKVDLMKEPKIMKFFQKVSKIMQINIDEKIVTERKNELKEQNLQKNRETDLCNKWTENGNSDRKRNISSKQYKKLQTSNDQRQIFISKNRERTKIEGKLSKQTIQLKQQFRQLIPRHKTIQKQMDFRFARREFAIRKQPIGRQVCDSTDRYQKQIINKIHLQTRNCVNFVVGPVMQIKKKQLRLKPKSNVRIQTELIPSEPISSTSEIQQASKIISSNSQAGNFYPIERSISTKQKESQYCINTNFLRPSFIEEFIMKIREERENPNQNKDNIIKQNKKSKLKYRPTLKQHIQQQEKKMLPVLRRNKIFTIVREQSEQEMVVETKNYDSLLNGKKRAVTVESEANINEIVKIALKNQGITKKQGLIREQKFKKVNELNEKKNH